MSNLPPSGQPATEAQPDQEPVEPDEDENIDGEFVEVGE